MCTRDCAQRINYRMICFYGFYLRKKRVLFLYFDHKACACAKRYSIDFYRQHNYLVDNRTVIVKVCVSATYVHLCTGFVGLSDFPELDF